MRVQRAGIVVLSASIVFLFMGAAAPVLLFLHWGLALSGFVLLGFARETRAASVGACLAFASLLLLGAARAGVTAGPFFADPTNSALGTMLMLLALPAALALVAVVHGSRIARVIAAGALLAATMSILTLSVDAPEGIIGAALAIGALAGIASFALVAPSLARAREAP